MTSANSDDRLRTQRRALIAGACLMAIGLLVVVLTAKDYGVAWDDYVQTRYGDLCLNYFLSAGRDRACNEFLDLKFYAPTFELIAAAAARVAPAHLIEIRHILCGAIALLAVPPLIGFGRLLGRPWLGVVALLALLLTPAYYGHSLVNTKDIPFAVGFAWSMYALAAMFARGDFSWREVLVCGLSLGAAVSVRPGGWMLLLPTYAMIAAWCDWRARTSGQSAKRTLVKQACLAITAWAVMVLPWPWAHENPWLHPLQAIRMASRFHIVVPVLFEGQLIASNQLPRHYLFSQLLLTTPPVILLLAVTGIVAHVSQFWRRPDQPRTIILVVLSLWLALPLALFIVLRPNTYDGLRHFLFLLPAIAIWCALGCERLWDQFTGKWPKAAIFSLLVLAAGCQIHSLVRLHPYQMTYFNFLAGGTAGASDRFDTECWLTSYKEAIEWIKHQPPPRQGEPPRVLVAANENSLWCAAYFAGDRLQLTATRDFGQQGDLPSEFDYYVGTSRCGMNHNFPLALVVHQIGREGAVFTTVKRAAQLTQIAADEAVGGIESCAASP